MPRIYFYIVLLSLVFGLNVAHAQAQTQAPAQGGDHDVVEQRDLDELTNAQKKAADQYKVLDAYNPLSASPKPAEFDASKLPPQLQFIGKLMQNPTFADKTKKFMALTADPKFQEASLKIVNHPNLKVVYAGLAAVLLLYLFLKSRILAATDNFIVKLILRFCMTAVFFVSAFAVVYGVLGQPVVYVFSQVSKLVL